jgi:hypothetical protein
MIYKFIRKTKTEISPSKKVKMKRTHKRGVLVAFVDPFEGKVKVGWSLANEKAGDKFDEDIGIQNAIERALKPSTVYARCLDGSVPKSILTDMIRFLDRCERYFKNGMV